MPSLRKKPFSRLAAPATKKKAKKHKSTKALLEKMLLQPESRRSELLVPLESEAGQNMQNPKVLYMLGIREVLTFDLLPSYCLLHESAPHGIIPSTVLGWDNREEAQVVSYDV
ncbi:hypothetical protein LTR86_005562 [Recurvomyces mirabilis]|nr:hypothetical protein LTR86_005562 [Recurvomyces mirabilis]